MTERNEEPIDVTAQVRRHLESLRAAGVEWLPASAPLAAPAVVAPPAVAPEAAPSAPIIAPTKLFNERVEAAAPLQLEQRRRSRTDRNVGLRSHRGCGFTDCACRDHEPDHGARRESGRQPGR